MTTRRRTILYGLSLAAILLFALAPLIAAFAGSAIADAHGCRLDEGGTYPCQAFGTDIGETLNIMFVIGWFGLMTLPAGATLLCVWTLVLAVDLIRLWVLRRKAKLGQ